MDAAILQDMADSGLSRAAIAALYGVSRRTVNYWCKQFRISTTGRSPRQEIHGVARKQAPKLMPSATALRAVSVFSLGRDVHASTVFRSPD